MERFIAVLFPVHAELCSPCHDDKFRDIFCFSRKELNTLADKQGYNKLGRKCEVKHVLTFEESPCSAIIMEE